MGGGGRGGNGIGPCCHACPCTTKHKFHCINKHTHVHDVSWQSTLCLYSYTCIDDHPSYSVRVPHNAASQKKVELGHRNPFPTRLNTGRGGGEEGKRGGGEEGRRGEGEVGGGEEGRREGGERRGGGERGGGKDGGKNGGERRGGRGR